MTDSSIKDDTVIRRSAILDVACLSAKYFADGCLWNDCINEILVALGAATGFDKIFLFQYIEDMGSKVAINKCAEWSQNVSEIIDESIEERFISKLEHLPKRDELIRGEIISGDFELVFNQDKKSEEIFSIEYLVEVPVQNSQKNWGYLGLYDLNSKKIRSEEEVDAIASVVGILGAEILRQQNDSVPYSTYKISEVAHRARNLDELCQSIHDIVSELMPAANFYVSLYEESTNMLHFPYNVDEYDQPIPPHKPDKGLTAYVLRTGEPILVTPEVFEKLLKSGDVDLIGAPSIDWLGVPLKIKDRTIGVIAVQSYSEGIRFSKKDMDMLVFVSTQVAMAIERKRTEEALRLSEEHYRSLVENIPIGIYRTAPGPEGKYLMANPAFLNMFGFDSEESLKKISEKDLYVKSEDRKLFSDSLLTQGRVSGVEMGFKKTDGTALWGSVTARVVEDDSGEVLYFDCAIEDITERTQRQREREALISFAVILRSAQTRFELVSSILDNLLVLMEADSAALVLYDSSKEKLEVEASRGFWSYLHGKKLQIDDTTSKEVIKTGKAFINNELESDPLFTPSLLFSSPRAIACVPLTTQDHIMGVIWMGRENMITTGDLQLLIAIGDMAASAIQRATLHEQTQRRVQRLSALRAVDMAIGSSMDLRVVLNVLLDQLTIHLNINAASVLLLKSRMQFLEYAAGRGFLTTGILQTRLRLNDRIVGSSILDHRIFQLNEISDGSESYFQERGLAGEKFVSYFAIPLVAKGQLKGVLELFHRTPLAPDLEWLDFLEMLAGQAAIAIDNATLFNELQRSNTELHLAYDTTLEGWVRALDLRDQETEGHTKRVTDVTIQLAREMGIPENELVHVRRGALLHDIGKMAISDSILQKPGPLTDEEWIVMRKHPVYAKDLLSPISYLRPAIVIPYCHHEKWDASGYPRGLGGTDIPLAARIFAIVDVWDALRSKRAYREAWPDEKVFDYLRQQIGIHFDPRISEKFFNIFDNDPTMYMGD
jgi:PAS domain S-box-containing protein/putative nucleotidyltransferase with HDIG domain